MAHIPLVVVVGRTVVVEVVVVVAPDKHIGQPWQSQFVHVTAQPPLRSRDVLQAAIEHIPVVEVVDVVVEVVDVVVVVV